MAATVVSNFTDAYRRLFRISPSSPEDGEANIGLEDSLRGANTPYYSDDPARPPLQPQQYVSSVTGELRLLEVQSTTLGGELLPAENWVRIPASGHADPILYLSAWVTGEGRHRASLAVRVLDWPLSILKAILLSPFYGLMVGRGIDGDLIPNRYNWPKQPMPDSYPKFLGRCRDYPKHTPTSIEAPPTHPRAAVADGLPTTSHVAKEQRRLYRPRKLYVKIEDTWIIMDGDGQQTELPYIFVSYAANQFERVEDASSRLVLTEDASKRLKQRAEAVTEQNGLEAYWIDFLRAPQQPEATDDVHRFCDVVRGSEQVCVLLSEERELNHSLAMFGKRLWCLPECLLAPKHVIYVQGGGKAETISIMQLPARAWTSSYLSERGDLVRGKGKEEEFRLLAEHFSGLLTLSRLELFSVALSAMRALEFFPFQRGDIAYALMGLLRKRPAMDDTDSEQQALARLCLSNDSDRILERIACILPYKDDDASGWFSTSDSYGANLWDIEPLCQVAGVCDDEAIIIDGSHAISISWDSTPRVQFSTRKTRTRKFVLHTLHTARVWAVFSWPSSGFLMIYYFMEEPGFTNDLTVYMLYIINLLLKSTLGIYLFLSFIAPFCIRFVYSGPIINSQSHLIGIEGTMPLEQLERLALGTTTKPGRLEYTAFSGPLCSRDPRTQKGICPVIDPQSLPAGHRVFTLLDTGNMTVTVFTAARPPTVALLCGKESGMVRAVMCSYSAETGGLRREAVLRRETRSWDRSAAVGWVKVAL